MTSRSPTFPIIPKGSGLSNSFASSSSSSALTKPSGPWSRASSASKPNSSTNRPPNEDDLSEDDSNLQEQFDAFVNQVKKKTFFSKPDQLAYQTVHRRQKWIGNCDNNRIIERASASFPLTSEGATEQATAFFLDVRKGKKQPFIDGLGSAVSAGLQKTGTELMRKSKKDAKRIAEKRHLSECLPFGPKGACAPFLEMLNEGIDGENLAPGTRGGSPTKRAIVKIFQGLGDDLAVAEQYQTNFIKGTGINVWDPDRRENLDPAQFLNLVQNSDALVNFRLSLPFSITDFSGKKYYWETLGLVQSQIKLLGYAADFISVDGTENAIYQANVYNQNEDLVCLLFFTPHLCNALSNFYGLSRVKKMESHFNGIIRLYVDDDGLLHPDFKWSDWSGSSARNRKLIPPPAKRPTNPTTKVQSSDSGSSKAPVKEEYATIEFESDDWDSAYSKAIAAINAKLERLEKKAKQREAEGKVRSAHREERPGRPTRPPGGWNGPVSKEVKKTKKQKKTKD